MEVHASRARTTKERVRNRLVAGKVDRTAAPKVRNPSASTNELATDIASAGGAA